MNPILHPPGCACTAHLAGHFYLNERNLWRWTFGDMETWLDWLHTWLACPRWSAETWRTRHLIIPILWTSLSCRALRHLQKHPGASQQGRVRVSIRFGIRKDFSTVQCSMWLIVCYAIDEKHWSVYYAVIPSLVQQKCTTVTGSNTFALFLVSGTFDLIAAHYFMTLLM